MLSAVSSELLPENSSQILNRSEVSGELHNLLVKYEFEAPENYQLSATAVSVASKVVDDIPGVTNLNANIVAGNNRIGLKLNGQAVSLDFGDLFRSPLTLDQVSFEASAQLNQFGTSIAVNNLAAKNRDAQVRGRAWLEFDSADRPFMYLRASFSDAQAGSAAQYMPVRIMPEQTVNWIDESIKKGVSPNGDLQFHGRLETVEDLEVNKAGEFFVDFRIEDAEVRFSPDWQAATKGEGRVVFHNMGVEVNLSQVSYDSIDGGLAIASIADFTDAYLKLDIKTESNTADAIRIWTTSPVGERFRKPIENFEQFAGKVTTEIDVNLPLNDQSDQKIRVLVNLDNGSAQSSAWGLDLSRVEGQIIVLDENIAATDIKGLFFGDPVSINIDTDSKLQQTILSGGGEFSTANLLTLFPEHWAARVSGKSDWRVRLAIENQDVVPESTYLTMNLASNLSNTRIDLPVPFGKESGQNKPVEVENGIF